MSAKGYNLLTNRETRGHKMTLFDGLNLPSQKELNTPKRDFQGIDPDLATWILGLEGEIEPVKLTKGIYYVQDGARVAKNIPPSPENLKMIASQLKYMIQADNLPDIIYLICASWFLTYLNLHKKDPELLYPFNKSIMIKTADSRVTASIKKIYWALRDLYYPNQSCQDGIVKYNDLETLFDKSSGWVKFHIVGLTHLPPDQFEKVAGAIGYQSSSLFIDKWPLICISDPAQTTISRGFFNIVL